MSADPTDDAADRGSDVRDEPFPAEAVLAAVAAAPLGPVGRFQVVCGEGGPLLVDTTDGRSWRLLGAGGGLPGQWTPLAFDPVVPPPAP